MEAKKIILFALPLFIACGTVRAADVRIEKAPGLEGRKISRVAFLPLKRVAPPGKELRAECPAIKWSFPACSISEAAEAELSRSIAHALEGIKTEVTLVPQAEINEARARLKKKGGVDLTSALGWEKAIGSEVEADAVLTGFIYCYRDRSGNSYASGTPAALSFSLHLIDPAGGEVLWSAGYGDEQAPLSDNLLTLPQFIKRGGKWITVEQMSVEAAAEVASVLPWAPAKKDKSPGGKK